jgi:hypothetical protein
MRSGSLGAGFPATFNGGANHRLAAAASPFGLACVIVAPRFLMPLALAADVRFVGFDKATQEPRVVLHHRADALAEKPCRLLSGYCGP